MRSTKTRNLVVCQRKNWTHQREQCKLNNTHSKEDRKKSRLFTVQQMDVFKCKTTEKQLIYMKKKTILTLVTLVQSVVP